jgi:hypothetical protein
VPADVFPIYLRAIIIIIIIIVQDSLCIPSHVTCTCHHSWPNPQQQKQQTTTIFIFQSSVCCVVCWKLSSPPALRAIRRTCNLIKKFFFPFFSFPAIEFTVKTIDDLSYQCANCVLRVENKISKSETKTKLHDQISSKQVKILNLLNYSFHSILMIGGCRKGNDAIS